MAGSARGDDCAVISVRVTPRSGRTEIDGTLDGTIRVRLTAPPVDGAANKELCDLLARRLGVPRRDVEITAGHRGRNKTVRVWGVSTEIARQRLLTGS